MKGAVIPYIICIQQGLSKAAIALVMFGIPALFPHPSPIPVASAKSAVVWRSPVLPAALESPQRWVRCAPRDPIDPK